jgi:hypothetical protein
MVFVMDKNFVLFEAGTEFLNTIYINFVFQMRNTYYEDNLRQTVQRCGMFFRSYKYRQTRDVPIRQSSFYASV